MAQQVVQMPLESGGTISIEVADDSEAAIKPVGRVEEAAATTARTLREALAEIRSAADEVVTQLRTTASGPDKITVQFGIKITGETSAIIAKASAEANFTITAEWQNPRPNRID